MTSVALDVAAESRAVQRYEETGDSTLGQSFHHQGTEQVRCCAAPHLWLQQETACLDNNSHKCWHICTPLEQCVIVVLSLELHKATVNSSQRSCGLDRIIVPDPKR